MEKDEDEKNEDTEEVEEAVFFCGVDTNEEQEEEAMVGLVYSHNGHSHNTRTSSRYGTCITGNCRLYVPLIASGILHAR